MKRFTSVIKNTSWVAPAGVTEVIIQPCNSTGSALGKEYPVTVVPNTTYVVTVVNSGFNLNNRNSFGSTFYWTNAGYIKIWWVE